MKFTSILTAAALTTAFGISAQTAPASGAEHSAHHPATSSAPQSDGEVRKVDREQGKVTLRHGPLQNLDMPAMTMVFEVREPSMLDKVQAGEKVLFRAANDGGKFSVTELQPAK